MSKKHEVANVPTDGQDLAVYSGPTGIADNITAADLHLPHVALLQAMSKSVQEEVTGHKAGVFVNTLTQEVLPTPLTFTPVFLFKNVIRWKPKSEGGGVLYKTMQFTKDVLKDISWVNNEKPVATQFINCVALVDGQDMPLVISFCNTSFKAGQDLLTFVQLSGCAWRYQYELTPNKVSNDKGTFYVMRIKRLALTDSAKTAAAAQLFENVKGMAIDTDYEGPVAEQPVTPTEIDPDGL